MSNGSVARLGIEDEVDEAIGRLLRRSHNKGSRVQALSETAAHLAGVRVSHEIDLDDWAGDVRLAHANKIFAIP